MSLFGRLGFNLALAGDNVTDFPETTKNHMNNVPDQLSQWQKDDLANADATGYFKNPVGTVTTNIGTKANTIIAVPHIGEVSNLSTIITSSQTLSLAASNFMGHTNRLSNLIEPNEFTSELPHYNTASAQGRSLMYILNKTDGIENTAPMIGHFTSLYTEDDLLTSYSTISSYPTTIQNNIIEVITETFDMNTGENVAVISYTTNLTPIMVATMATELTNISTYMNSRRTNDVTFFNNAKTIIDEYNTVKQFSNMGQSQSDMMQLIGSDKLKSRLNS
jgi:hypothetical protein